MPWHFKTVFHPTTFSGADDAFAHALRIAMSARGGLELLHVSAPGETPDFSRFPTVRRMLNQWGMLPKDAAEDDILDRFGVRISANLAWNGDPVGVIARAVTTCDADLLVLSTADRTGMPDLLQGSTAEAIVRSAHRPALCVRRHGRGFVSSETGRVTLRTALVPVTENVGPERAIDALLSLQEAIGEQVLTVHLLHIGGAPPELPQIYAPNTRFVLETAHGSVVDAILAREQTASADIVCVPTAAQRSIGSLFVGGISERLLRHAASPVLLVPSA